MSRKKKKYPVGLTMCYEIINYKVVDGIGSVYGDSGWYLVVLGYYKTQLLLLGKFEYTGGPIFKVVLEC